MTKIDANYVISAIDDVLKDGSLMKWDYLLSVDQKDDFARTWAERLKEIERRYGVFEPKRYLSDEGLIELMNIRNELTGSAPGSGAT